MEKSSEKTVLSGAKNSFAYSRPKESKLSLSYMARRTFSSGTHRQAYWDGWRHRPEWDSLYAPLLVTLAAAFEPISLDTLKTWANAQEGPFPLRRLLKEDWVPSSMNKTEPIVSTIPA